MTDLAKWLAGGVALATAVFGFLGATGGNVERILRNSSWEFPLALALLLLAVALGALAPALDWPTGRKVWMLGVGSLLLVASLVWLAALAARSDAAKERPHITATVTSGSGSPILKGTVDASGLKIDEDVVVSIWGGTRRQPLARDHVGIPRDAKDPAAPSGPSGYAQLLYGTRTGPGPGGKLSHSFEFPIPAGLYDELDIYAQLNARAPKGSAGDVTSCDDVHAKLGCLTIFLPPTQTGTSSASTKRVP